MKLQETSYAALSDAEKEKDRVVAEVCFIYRPLVADAHLLGSTSMVPPMAVLRGLRALESFQMHHAYFCLPPPPLVFQILIDSICAEEKAGSDAARVVKRLDSATYDRLRALHQVA
jgi:hypothetical protein